MHRLLRHTFSRVYCNTFLCCSVIGGVAAAYFQQTNLPPSVLIACIVMPLCYVKRGLLSLAFIIFCGTLIGLARGGVYQQQRTMLLDFVGSKHTLIAVANSDAVYDARHQLSFTASQLEIDGQKYAGQAQVAGFGVGAILAGDTVMVNGKLRAGFGSSQISMGFAQLQVVHRQSSPVAVLRRRFAAGIQSALPEPAASLGLGILIGQRSTLPKAVKNDLLMVGLTHIIAVSGYNLTIIIQSLNRTTGRLSKRTATFLSFGAMVLFLLITGSSASIVRAAIVSSLSIVAAYYGRSFRPLLLVLLAAAITALMNPYYVWGDASWFLSMLAFFGILVVAPIIVRRLRIKGFLLLLVIETMSAEVMTIPYIMLMFSQVSLLGLVANVLIVPLVPLAMLCSFLAGLAGMLIAPIAGWFAWPALVCLTYIIDASHLMAQVPHSFLQHVQLGFVGMVVLYALLLAGIILMEHRTKQLKHARITDINLSQPSILAEETS